jgi:hypothetical protein
MRTPYLHGRAVRRSPLGAALLGVPIAASLTPLLAKERNRRRTGELLHGGGPVSRETRWLPWHSGGRWPRGFVVLERTPDRACRAAVTVMRRSSGFMGHEAGRGPSEGVVSSQQYDVLGTPGAPDPADDRFPTCSERHQPETHAEALRRRKPSRRLANGDKETRACT